MLNRAEWEADNAFARFDSEFQIKAYRDAIVTVRNSGAQQLGEGSLEIIHPHELKREFIEEGGTWFLRTQNVRQMRIDENNKVYLPKIIAARLKRNTIRRNDILITRTGANRGDCAMFDLVEHAVASSHTFIVRSGEWGHPYLTAFLNSRYGKDQIDKGVYGAAQPELAPYYLKNIWVPEASAELQATIEKVLTAASAASASSSATFAKAEASLLNALGLGEWSPPDPLTYTRSAASVAAANRLDAQFHAPAVLALQARLAEQFELTTLGSLGEVTNGRAVQYGEGAAIPIIRSGDVGKSRELEDLLHADTSEPIFFLQQNDVLISSIGFGSIGRIEAVNGNAPLGTVSEVTVVRQDALDAHYLAAFLRSYAGQKQIDRFITGATGQLHLYPRDVRDVFVPVLDEKTQLRQRDLAEEASTYRAKSTRLLAAAKRAVEIAIEDSEAAALAFVAEQENGHADTA